MRTLQSYKSFFNKFKTFRKEKYFISEKETVWLNRNQLALLFGRDVKIINEGGRKDSAQYPQIEMIETKNIHNRFLIVDDDIYHIVASLKDVGKKLFAFNLTWQVVQRR